MSLTWLEPFIPFMWTMASLSVVFFILSLFLVPWLIIRLPRTYFLSENRRPLRSSSAHPTMDFLFSAAKNLIGTVFIMAGLAMLVLPGQGLLTILIGITFTNFPGKYRLEQALARKHSILRGMNWIRRKAKHPPLLPPPDKD